MNAPTRKVSFVGLKSIAVLRVAPCSSIGSHGSARLKHLHTVCQNRHNNRISDILTKPNQSQLQIIIKHPNLTHHLSTTMDPYLLTAIGLGLSTFMTAIGSALASGHGAIYVMKAPNLKAMIPVIMGGVLAIYGLIINYFLYKNMDAADMSYSDGCKNLAAGLSVGAAVLASGWGMAIFIKQLNAGVCDGISTPAPSTDAPVSENSPLLGGPDAVEGIYAKPNFIKTILSLIYLEAIGLYGLIVALFLVY